MEISRNELGEDAFIIILIPDTCISPHAFVSAKALNDNILIIMRKNKDLRFNKS